MADAFSPVVHGGRNQSFWRALGAHVIGAGIAAASLGVVLGSIGSVFELDWSSPSLVVVAALAAIYAAGELAGFHLPIPHRKAQVPEWWRSYFTPTTTAFLYGAGLGVGFATHVRSALLPVVAGLALLSGSPLLGAVVLAPFGIARATSVLVGFDAAERLGGSRLPEFVSSGALLVVSVAASQLVFSV
jgi:hypothetical protein